MRRGTGIRRSGKLPEDMDEEKTQSEIWTFCCPTRVLEWIGKFPGKGKHGFPRTLDGDIMETEENGLAVSLDLLFGVFA